MSLSIPLFVIFYTVVLNPFVLSFTERGKWRIELERNASILIAESMFNGSQVFVKITCHSTNPNAEIVVQWSLRGTRCWADYLRRGSVFHGSNSSLLLLKDFNMLTIKSNEQRYPCSEHVQLEEFSDKILQEAIKEGKDAEKKPARRKRLDTQTQSQVITDVKPQLAPHKVTANSPLVTISSDGVYSFELFVTSDSEYKASAYIEMLGKYGYLSAVDWPLLPFYGAMCLVYVIFGIAWLLVSFCQWRELLRIQFWIGGVILLGMLEKATFYAEYQSMNNTGKSSQVAVLFAEWVSCGKRTLARMLVIIVSLGFGIVKPRLGSLLHRVVGVGTCYFVLAAIESYLRVMRPIEDSSNQLFIASIPLVLLDTAISWWIFTSLVQTTRTLRLRRNLVKLNLYRHFTNTLIFSVVASVIFMLYSLKTHRFVDCLTDWKELWADEAYWHVLFSVVLLVIMILWRPTNNNQRFAFTPLLDAPEDEEEEDQFVNDAYGVKMRGYPSRTNSPKPKLTPEDEALKWVEENIPSAGIEPALPVLDSDEELMTTKFELSKLQ